MFENHKLGLIWIHQDLDIVDPQIKLDFIEVSVYVFSTIFLLQNSNLWIRKGCKWPRVYDGFSTTLNEKNAFHAMCPLTCLTGRKEKALWKKEDILVYSTCCNTYKCIQKKNLTSLSILQRCASKFPFSGLSCKLCKSDSFEGQSKETSKVATLSNTFFSDEKKLRITALLWTVMKKFCFFVLCTRFFFFLE